MRIATGKRVKIVRVTLPVVSRMIKEMNRGNANLRGWWAYDGEVSFYSFRIIDCPGLEETLEHRLWGKE